MSRIEEENSGDNLAADLKELLGRGGKFCDVCFFSVFFPFQNHFLSVDMVGGTLGV